MSTITITHMMSSIGRKELDMAIKRDAILYIFNEMNLRNNRSSVDTLLDYLQTSHDFPDNELAENVEKAHDEFRKNFRLQSS
ncbi:MAG: hypothetical protein WAM14_16985 [Candidatus Nitrosopolaris sp.]